MRNLLIDEYREILSQVGHAHMADEGGKVGDDLTLRWECRLTGLSLSIDVAPGPDRSTGSLSLIPRARSTGATAIMGPVWDIGAKHRAAAALCDRVHVAYLEVAGFTIWDRDCPCDHCGGRGYGSHPTHTCKTCHGTGKRQPKGTA
jgi:hypothetical protein